MECARDEYRIYCTRSEKSSLIWFKTGTWKMTGMRERSGKEEAKK
jgi:hypothetical protein